MFRRIIVVVALALLCALPLLAQTNRGTLSGTVFDASGGVVPGAAVTITNLGTAHKLQLVTTEEGVYQAPNLDPVSYSIEVEMPGFRKAIVERVKVDTATTTTVNVTLQIGEAQGQTIDVTAEAPMINADSGTAAQTISERQISDLPVNNRSVLDLALTVANVTGDPGNEDPDLASTMPTPGFNLFINGGRAGSTNILADGARNTGVGLARAVVTFSPDSVQEFTVQTSNFSAEYGQSGGGIINMTTKSGTNRLEGVLTWYNRNPVFQATTFSTTNIHPKRNLRQNQFGAIVGGPVVIPKLYDGHDKTFFFVSLEPRWYSESNLVEALLPTDAMRQGDYSDTVNVSGAQAPKSVVAQFPQLTGITDVAIYNQYTVQGNMLLRPTTLAAGVTFPQFPNNVIPSTMLDPTSLKIQEFFPHAGDYFISSTNSLANYSSTNFIKEKEVRLTTKLDHQISNMNRLSGRYTQVPVRGDKGCCGFELGVNELYSGGTDYSWSRQMLLTDTHSWTTMVNELRLNYTRGRFTRNMPPMYDVYSGQNFSTEMGLPSITKGGLPSFSTGAWYMGFSQSQQNENIEQTYNITDNFTWIHNDMSWKFGADLADMRLKTAPMYGGPGGRYEFNRNTTLTNSALNQGTGGAHYPQFLLGIPNMVTMRDSLFTYYYRWKSAAGFVQNDWKIRPNVTLNLGLRYTLQYPREEMNGLQAVFRPDLAKEYDLLAPVTLANGVTLTKALVPPMAFAGRGGRSKYLLPVDYNGWEPRFGFAWVPRLFGWNASGKFVLRGGYGLSHGTLTGMDRNANPDFSGTTAFNAPDGGVKFETVTIDNVTYNQMMRLSSNPPNLVPKTPQERLQIPDDGLMYLESINYYGLVRAVSDNYHVPYVQSFSLLASYELPQQTVLEVAYTGSKGTHLFLPPINQIPRSYDVAESFFQIGINPDANTSLINDPLGRKQPNGSVYRIYQGDGQSKYLGFPALYSYLDSSSNSIRHGMYISVRRRMAQGLSFTSNYTYAKSIDDASDSGGVRFVDYNIIRSNGQVMAGAPRSLDRSVSTFDVRHSWNGTFLWDVPVGHGRKFMSGAPGWLDHVVGGWTLTGSSRIQQGTPLVIVIRDGNQLAAGNLRAIRPNLVPGVPLKNPLWSPYCPIGTSCEPWFNPSAFTRPAKGEFGNAPRTIDAARWPTQHTLDLSLQKNWRLGGEGRRRLQLRADAINAFNHKIFSFGRDSDNGEIFAAPSEATINNSEYDAWQKFAPSTRPARSTPEGKALLAQINAMISSYNTNTNPSSTALVLPKDFFVVQVPQGFATANLNSFDITNVDGLKLFRLKQAYAPDRWGFLGVTRGAGALISPYTPRYFQFALKLFF